MPLHLNRRFWPILILDFFVILGLMGVFAVVSRSRASKIDPFNERILSAPPGLPADKSDFKEASIRVTTAEDSIHLEKLLAKSVTVTRYQVEVGENYWSIAKENHLNVGTLIGANPDLPFKAPAGITINILPKDGALHTVEKGETLKGIAAAYQVDEKALRAENPTHWWRGLKEGDVLFIPGAKPVRMTREWKDYFSKRGIFGTPFSQWASWTSSFGLRTDPITGEERSHKGLDLRAKYGVPVYASASGRVLFTGVAGGYGNLIQIKHKDGYVTYYGHLSKILVKSGQKVRRGTLIGKVGATGRVTGPHLHFEIRKNGKALDPLALI